jgi:hypothetical protein
MHCFPFKKCARGYFPAKTEYADSAVFLLSPSLDEDASVSGYIPSSFRPRLMRVAQDSTDRVWEPPSFLYEGQVHYGLIDGACDRNVKLTNTVEVTTPSGTYYEFWWTTRGVNGWTPTWTIIGSYCCVPSDGAIGVSKFGLRYFQIIGIIAGGSQHKVLCREVDSIDNFCTEVNPVGNATHLTINPVVFKIGTSPMPGVIPTTGFMTNKEVTSTGVMLAACELSPAMGKTVDADSVFPRWFAGVYSGDSYFPFSIGTPVNPSKQANSISIVDGASPIHAPFDKKLDTYQSVTFLANAVGMDFRVIAMNVRGRILETERNKNSYA